jgi:thioredoxin-related protein
LTCRYGSKVRLYNQEREKVNLVGGANQLAHTSELTTISSKQYLFILNSYDCIYCSYLLTSIIMIYRAIISFFFLANDVDDVLNN